MRHPLRLVMVIVVLLMGLSLDHGLPERYVPDDTVVRCALGIARDLAGGDGAPDSKLEALVPPAGKYTTYPYVLPYLDLGAVGATYVLGRVTGAWGGTGEFREAVFENPGVAWLPGRLVSVLLALLVPWGVYRAARELRRDRVEAAVGALLAGTSLLLVQYAHTTRPWAPMIGFGAASLALGLRLQRKQRARDVAAAFVPAALAAGTLQVGPAFLAVPFTAWVVAWFARDGEGRQGPAALGKGLLVGVAAMLLVLAVGWPHVLVHGKDTGSGHIAGDDVDVSLEVGGQAFVFDLSGRLLLPVLRSWFGYDPALLLLGVAGVFALTRGRRPLAAWLLLVAPTVCFAGLFLLYDGTHVRYLMPTVPFLGVGAGVAAVGLARRGGAARVLALLLVALPLVQAARFDQLLARTDTRSLAAAELPGLVGADELIALDGMGSYYGPPLRPTADSLRPIAALGLPLNRKEQRILTLDDLGVAEPEHARPLLPIQRFWIYDSYYPTDYIHPPTTDGSGPVELGDFLTNWDVAVYVQVDRLPDEARRQPITDLMAARGTLLAEWSPTGQSLPAEAALPTDMAFALTGLWTYQRPGPWVRAWRLDAESDG